MKKNILGIKIDDVSMVEAVEQVGKWIWNPGKHYIVTPNPEMIVAAQKDPIFKAILNKADLSIPDGVGLKLSGRIKNTFAGTDFMERLISLAVEKGFTIGLLGGKGEVAKKCAECLQKKYPNLKVVFAEDGPAVDINGNVDTRSIPTIKIPPCDIFFVAFGHIKQEKWIADNLDKVPVHVAMGVGGSFDYLSGSVPRAPMWMRSLGFEWLFRLMVQPWRIKRQLSLIKYLWLLVVK